MPSIQAGGIGSGLDINNLVSQLVAAEGEVQINRLNRQEMVAQGELSGLGSLKGALSDFEHSIQVLKSAAQLGGRIANNSNNSIFTVSVDENAPPGDFSIEVETLAAAQKVATGAFQTTTTTVGSGTLNFQFGTYNSEANTFTLNASQSIKSVTIPSSSSNLQGIRDAVNNAQIGVSATIIQDSNGQRLIFTSTASGAENTLSISVQDDDGNNTDMLGLSQLAYDPTAVVGSGQNMTQTQAGVDAHLVIDGIDIYNPTNTVTTAIEGLTINLLSASPGTTCLTTIDLYTANASSRVSGFVTAYNKLVTSLKDLTGYDPETKKAGILNGDPTARGVEIQMRNIISAAIPGVYGNYCALADIGVSTNSDGTLKLDNTVLTNVINTDFSAIAPIFASVGTIDDPLIEFNGYTIDSAPGEYDVNITQLATQGQWVGSDPANLTITQGVNDSLVMNVDGQAVTILLDPGTYAIADLVTDLQSRINGNTLISNADLGVTVTQNAGVLSITSNQYGSESVVSVTGGTALTGLFGSTPVSTAGLDVAGSIGGVDAIGSGQILTAGGPAAGINIQVNGGALGSRGTISFTQGVAVQLSEVLQGYVGYENILDERERMTNERIKGLGTQRTVLDQRLEDYKTRLIKQFTSLDMIVSRLRATSDFLQKQLANMPAAHK